jgi:hypothetical protein
MKEWDSTAKRNFRNTKRTHRHQMCNNTPREVPAITPMPPQIIHTVFGTPHEKQRLTRVLTQRTYPTVEGTPGHIIIPLYPVPGRIRMSACLISQQALNMLTMKEALNPPRAFTSKHFVCKLYEEHIPNYAHFASPMVHPTTGETINSYKQLMHDPQTADLW